MADPYESFQSSPDSFGKVGRLITPGAEDLSPLPKAVVCLTAGNITVLPLSNADGATLSFVGVPAGYVPPFRVRKVTAATAAVAAIEG